MGKHSSGQKATAMVDEVRGWIADGKAVAAREAAGLSQADLARQLGVSQSTVAHWETRGVVPTGRNLTGYHRFISKHLAAAAATR